MNKFLFTLHLADTSLIAAQRNAEWTGHGPVLEQDIAITNISLDQLGQARNFYQYATRLYNGFNDEEKESIDTFLPLVWKEFHRELQEDDLAFLREEHQYLNVLLAELPKGDWAVTILRAFFLSAYQKLLFNELLSSGDEQLAGIAEKSIKEVNYHVKWSSEWVVRLGDGTAESAGRINDALSNIWMFTGEMFQAVPYELVDVAPLKEKWMEQVKGVFSQAKLEVPTSTWMQTGGKQGKHTEYMGYLLAEMQYLQRTYPNATW